ncbi:sensor histidine kinase [Nocardioides zeicaulis]|uniref:histidine kinase n=1 Tax=Nocardioides zeicaulis TaxID=1776857 RepID=A0ABV6E2A0_9ACTN
MGRRSTQVSVATAVVATALLSFVAAARSSFPEDLAGAPRLGGAPWLVGELLVLAQAVLLLLRDRAPLALVVTAVAAPLGALVGLGPAIGATSVAVLVAAYRVASRRVDARGGGSLAVAAVLVATGELLAQRGAGAPAGQAVAGAVVQGLGVAGLGALVGVVVGTRRETRAARAEQLRAETGERTAMVEAAVARERTAMARELHDIAAHHLTGIAVMSAAISKQVDRDPAAAKEAIEQVREQTTSMLRDMRGLVGMLRSTGQDPTVAPTRESLDGIPALVEAARERGEPVHLIRSGPADRPGQDDVGPLVQLAAYRTVQEALTNAARHAPGQECRVEVDTTSADALRLTVVNDLAPAARRPSPSRAGFGLVGMRERAELTGCRLEHGEVDGTWRVTLAIPIDDGPRLAAPSVEGTTT